MASRHKRPEVAAVGLESLCGWLADKFGVSWQIVPRSRLELPNTPDCAAPPRAFAAMLTMMTLDVAAMRRAREGAQ
jgi:predicted 3-demethylubiquinone-9 3-methyltransferase (glyoxalase superfamily)